MHERIIVAGSGGQGIVFAGRVLAAAALRTVPHLTLYPNYGAEVRGGSSTCLLVFSSREIASPVSDRFEVAMLMTPAAVGRYLPLVVPGGVAVVNTSLAPLPAGAAAVGVDAMAAAERLGDARAANMVMLGACLAARPGLCPAAEVEAAIADICGDRPEAAELNRRAFRAGLNP